MRTAYTRIFFFRARGENLVRAGAVSVQPETMMFSMPSILHTQFREAVYSSHTITNHQIKHNHEEKREWDT